MPKYEIDIATTIESIEKITVLYTNFCKGNRNLTCENCPLANSCDFLFNLKLEFIEWELNKYD